MKNWWVYLLLLLTMAGSFIPCCQVDNCPEDQLTTTTTNSEDHQPEGACSPFFACATCPGFTQLAKSIHLIKPEPVMPEHFPAAINFTLSTYAASLLQPPQIA